LLNDQRQPKYVIRISVKHTSILNRANMLIFADRDFCTTRSADGHVSLAKKQCVRRTSISDDNNNIIMILQVISLIVCVQTSAHASHMFLYRYTPASENYRTVHVCSTILALLYKAQPIVFSQPMPTSYNTTYLLCPVTNLL